jgi:hypothetical protein
LFTLHERLSLYKVRPVSARQSPERAIDILRRVASGATVLRGKRGDDAEQHFGRGEAG